MTRGQNILEDLLTEHGITLTESATRADILKALRDLTDALERDRIPASREEGA